MKGTHKDQPFLSCRFLIVGGGVAGLRAAIEAAPHGKTLLVNKGKGDPSSSMFAQGGIAAAISEETQEIASHLQDTMKAGHGLCREEAVRILVEEGPKRVQELIEWGASFDRSDGKFLLTREAAHSQSRILRARGDATGDEIMKTLRQRTREIQTVQMLDGYFAVDLWVSAGTCQGILLLEESTLRLLWVRAQKIILTTGGVGQVYLRTTNPPVATGDGMAMAHRAGASMEDMEFVQFHPTALSKAGAPCFLLSEAMRGEGALLRNHSGHAFMLDYDPAGELAPRDRVARAIWQEMGEKRDKPVFLDITHREPEFIQRRFPTIYRTCLSYGIDMTKDWIPVAPSVHYMMGGIKTDLFGRTTLPNVLAAGEVACTGVHGANRLASNSLLEGLVFGARCGRAALEPPRESPSGELDAPPAPKETDMNPGEAGRIRDELRRLMWEKVGIVRTETGLAEALGFIEAWLLRTQNPPLKKDFLELRNLLEVARLITRAALNRRDSIGSHFRSDYPAAHPQSYHITL